MIKQKTEDDTKIMSLELAISHYHKLNQQLRSEVDSNKSKIRGLETKIGMIQANHETLLKDIRNTHKVVMEESNKDVKVQKLNISLVRSRAEYEHQIRLLN